MAVWELATCHRYELPGWGTAELWTDGGVVLSHDLVRVAPEARAPLVPSGRHPSRADVSTDAPRPGAPWGDARPPSGTVAAPGAREGDDFVSDVCRRVRRRLEGHEERFGDLVLDLSWCTPFQLALATHLRGVGWGEVVSYGELAALAGRPGAARAAGTFCARNRFWLFLPCHRVVAADGIGGYGDAGRAFKRRLLELEGVAL